MARQAGSGPIAVLDGVGHFILRHCDDVSAAAGQHGQQDRWCGPMASVMSARCCVCELQFCNVFVPRRSLRLLLYGECPDATGEAGDGADEAEASVVLRAAALTDSY